VAVAVGKRQSIPDGPHSGVYNTRAPFDQGHPSRLIDARNLYSPDPEGLVGMYARPGFTLGNSGSPVYTSAVPFKGQGVWTHFGLDGQPVNFLAMGGKLFREDAATGLTTDVTPVGVVIDSATTTRVTFNDMGGVMCVNDGVHRPWVASNLSATPITGTYIDFDSAGTAWVAFAGPYVWGGSGFFVLTSVNGVAARIDIVWSEPNDWTTGYQQTDYDNRWTLEQTGTTPIFALDPSNTDLGYFRQRSIGAISGTVGADLATTATHDLVSANVGTEAPQTVVQFGRWTYFCDVIGRPWRYSRGSEPEPIWHQMQGVIDDATVGFPGVTARTATAAFDPSLNQYCVAIWSPAPGASASPTEWHAFDANSGTYVGPWSIGPANPGVSVDCLGSWIDNQGRGQLVVLGSAVPGGDTGYLWSMSALVGVPDTLVLEDLTTILTDESTPGVEITTEGQVGTWMDDGDVPLIYGTTDRLGYSEDFVWLYDSLTVLTGNDAPIAITATTPNAADQAEGTPTPMNSADGVYRSQMGLDLQGRGLSITVSPTTADEQWSLQRVTVVGIPSLALPDDA
jgi:hypothetical protein